VTRLITPATGLRTSLKFKETLIQTYILFRMQGQSFFSIFSLLTFILFSSFLFIFLSCCVGSREYTRALNATKLERVFAKPLVGALSGHRDGVYALAKNPKHLSCLLSGSADGGLLQFAIFQLAISTNKNLSSSFTFIFLELRVWNLTSQ